MDNQKEVLPLRIVAARFISSDEKEGLAELDRITAGVYRLIQRKYLILWTAMTVALGCTLITMVPGIGFALAGNQAGATLAEIGLIPFCFLMGVLAYWRTVQYGGTRATKPQTAIYANPDAPAVRNLELLFGLLQSESTPRAFYFNKHGRRLIDERYFFGSLRAAYVTKDNTVRDALFAPIGFWFSREIFMETNVPALIAQAKAKPSAAGTKRTYDYEDAIISLIEHPTIRNMEIGKRGNQTKIVNLMEASYRDRRKTPPSEGQLSGRAKLILEIIEKNRSAKS